MSSTNPRNCDKNPFSGPGKMYDRETHRHINEKAAP